MPDNIENMEMFDKCKWIWLRRDKLIGLFYKNN
jgi:hypothetical protein